MINTIFIQKAIIETGHFQERTIIILASATLSTLRVESCVQRLFGSSGQGSNALKVHLDCYNLIVFLFNFDAPTCLTLL